MRGGGRTKCDAPQKFFEERGRKGLGKVCFISLGGQTPPDTEFDMDWIQPWIGLDWIRSGFSGNFMDWILWGGYDPVLVSNHCSTAVPLSQIMIYELLTTHGFTTIKSLH